MPSCHPPWAGRCPGSDVTGGRNGGDASRILSRLRPLRRELSSCSVVSFCTDGSSSLSRGGACCAAAVWHHTSQMHIPAATRNIVRLQDMTLLLSPLWRPD